MAKSSSSRPPDTNERSSAVVLFNESLKALQKGADNDLTRHAKNACGALDILRRSHKDRETGKDARYKREYGALLLLDKLIGLDMGDLAYTQACKIHEQQCERPKSAKDGYGENKTPFEYALSTLFQVEATAVSKRDFDMQVSFQRQILRLATLRGEGALTDEFLDMIKVEPNGSPFQVITNGHEAGFIDAKKAGTYLQITAQVLSKLCHLYQNDMNVFFALLSAVQAYKLAAWRMLGEPSDIQQEFGPRFERLASMRMGVGDTKEGRRLLQQAIQHYVKSSALADAVEISLSGRIDAVWSTTTSAACQLARALHILNATELDDECLFVVTEVIHDDDSLPDTQRAVLLELQVIYVMRKYPRREVFGMLYDRVRAVLELMRAPQFYVWRLRLVSSFAYRATQTRVLTHEDRSDLAKLLIASLQAPPDRSVLFLQQYETCLHAQTVLQIQLLGNHLSDKDMHEELCKAHELLFKQANVTEVVDDSKCFDFLLRAFAKQTLGRGDYKLAKVCLKMQILLTKVGPAISSNAILDCHIELAKCQLRTDDLDAARASLAAAEELLPTDSGEHDRSSIIQFHLALAELQIDTCHWNDATIHLRRAGKALDEQFPADVKLRSAQQLQRDAIIARSANLASQLAFHQGHLSLAHQYARQAAKISMSIWAALERQKQRSEASEDNADITSLTQDVSKLAIDSTRNETARSCLGAALWPHLQLYIRSLNHAAHVASHSGTFDDALHYYMQLEKLHRSLNGDFFMNSPVARLALLHAKAGNFHEAQILINDYGNVRDQSKFSMDFEQTLVYAEACYVIGDKAKARKLLQSVEITKSIPPSRDVVRKLKAGVSEPASTAPHITKSKTSKILTSRSRQPSKKPAIKAVAKRAVPSSNDKSTSQLVQNDRHKALLRLLASEGSDIASSPPEDTEKFMVEELFMYAQCNLEDAWNKLCADSMQSVLTESAVALPTKVIVKGRHGRVSFLQGGADKVMPSTSKRPNQSPKAVPRDNNNIVVELLESAHKTCTTLLEQRRQFCPTDVLHAVTRIVARISLLLATMNVPFTIASTDLILKVSQPKDEAIDREMMAAAAETATRDRASLSVWPTEVYDRSIVPRTVSAQQLSELPSSWSIVSVMIAEDVNELVVSKIVSDASPFVIRIPLRRSNEGEGVGEFVFADARNEMKAIIEAANASSHDPRGMGDKSVRGEWHADREKLDQRLNALLLNIELSWLGGFRGIFDPHSPVKQDIEQFRERLTRTLDTYLPSRQKNNSSPAKIEIHDHILEVFLGLGDPDHDDLDDAIIDLLYFVVDIFQFNGEKNAYDEIDWDAMLVDIIDALRAHHESKSAQKPRHTILVLDKELECFPWECLPCLINHPVSRMPSLCSVFDRLDQIRQQSDTSDSLSIPTSSARGCYILNPSGDLKSTQTLFEPILSSQKPTSSFTALVQTPPTETQISNIISTSDMVLYFGHGSGAQYIRPRNIRALQKCAVTFLFGCSSAKMTEHGAFESTGMPRAYMLGYSPAVVGCLWDVTDREIDRVALKALSEWGLIDKTDERVKEGLKMRGRKGKAKETGTKNESKEAGPRPKGTLIEAVRDGREACVLKYLCGAAVVVYGIPVVLD